MNLNNYYIFPDEKEAVKRILEKDNLFKLNYLIDSVDNNIKLTDLTTTNWEIYKDSKKMLEDFKKIFLAMAKDQLNKNSKVKKIYIPLSLKEAHILSESKEFLGILAGTEDKFVARTKQYNIEDLVIIEAQLHNIAVYKTEEELDILETILLSPPFSIEDMGEKYLEEGRTFLKFKFRNIKYDQEISKIRTEIVKKSINEKLDNINLEAESKAIELQTYYVKEKENYNISKELSSLKQKYLELKQLETKQNDFENKEIIEKEETANKKDDIIKEENKRENIKEVKTIDEISDKLDELNVEIKAKIEEFNINQEIMENSIESIAFWKKQIREYLEKIYIEAVSEIEKERNYINDAKDFTSDERKFYSEVNAILKNNKDEADKILKKVETFIKFQQKFAKIAADANVKYLAVADGFKIREVALELKTLMDNIYEEYKDYYMALTKKKTEKNLVREERYKKIIESNNQIGILINYFNNPKSLPANTSLDRFAELSLIEENELKRKISEYVFKIIAKAHIELIYREIDFQENKTALEKLILFLTGRKDIEEFKMSENEYKIEKIEEAISTAFPIDQNYSIHQVLAQIMMFKRENEKLLDDIKTEVEEDREKGIENEEEEATLQILLKTFEQLNQVEDTINQNFGINIDKVVEIITSKSPLALLETKEKKTINELELIENQTNSFLKQYGYSKTKDGKKEYTDTVANELKKIIDYTKVIF